MRAIAFASIVIGALCLPAVAVAAGQAAPAPAAAEPFARPNRLAMSFSFGFGSASLSSYHGAVDWVASEIQRQNAGTTVDAGELKSNFQINAQLGFRYYFPYHVLAEVGYGALYNWATGTAKAGPYQVTIESHNLVMEVPILIGGYMTFIDRLYVHAAIGPSVFFYSRAWWDPGMDFEAETGVGMHAAGGADYLVGEHFGLGLELRYRYLDTGELKVKNTNVPFTVGTETYSLDLSGISLMLHLRFFVL